ncbi:MAG: ribosome biogenesis factor YjgA [Brachymonas sp.]|nr:ribosome biogenesis factor YjgA [Brachymonas sp.]
MSRKPQRGYYVRGQFVAEGSEMDLELKRQEKWDAEFSKTDRKRQSEELQTLGEELLGLRTKLLDGLDLPESLLDALAEAKRISDFEGRRRQMQYVGKLMRKLDEADIEAIRAALQEQRSGHADDVLLQHQTEGWRERLLAEQGHEQAVTEWMQAHPSTDAQQLRALIRQARKDQQALPKAQPGEGLRQGRAYRELFQFLREVLQSDQQTPA